MSTVLTKGTVRIIVMDGAPANRAARKLAISSLPGPAPYVGSSLVYTTRVLAKVIQIFDDLALATRLARRRPLGPAGATRVLFRHPSTTVQDVLVRQTSSGYQDIQA